MLKWRVRFPVVPFLFLLPVYLCLFALYPCLLPSLCPSLHMTLPNPPLGFLLTEGQPGRIYPSEIKRGKEKKPMGASWGKIAYPGVNPRTGEQVNRLPALTASILAHQHHRQRDQSFYKWKLKMKTLLGNKENLHIIYILCLFLKLPWSASGTRFLSVFPYKHMNAEPHSYLYDSGLGGMPVRCEECDGIIESPGLPPPITQQSGLVLIFLWKHPGWKWCRKQQVAR